MFASPHGLALASAFFSAVGTILIQRGLQRSNFYAGFWINVMVGVVVPLETNSSVPPAIVRIGAVPVAGPV